MLGDLIILTRDNNRSYQDMNYLQKVAKYVGDNILAQALSAVAYENNPQFKPPGKGILLCSDSEVHKKSALQKEQSGAETIRRERRLPQQ